VFERGGRAIRTCRCGGGAAFAAAAAIAVGAGCIRADLGVSPAVSSAADVTSLSPDLLSRQWAQFEADEPKSILELQPFRGSARVDFGGDHGPSGHATLLDLNPAIHVWFLLRIELAGRSEPLDYHLENPQPARQRPRLAEEQADAVRITGLTGSEPCELWSRGGRSALDEAAHSGLPYAPVCGARLYLRNPVTGHRTSLERITDFLRDHVYGGEEIISFVKEQVYRDAFLQREGVPAGTAACPPLPSSSSALPLPAAVTTAAAGRCFVPGSFGLDVAGASAGFSPGRWYAVSDLPGIYASSLTPGDMTAEQLSGSEPHVNRLDAVETQALVYLVAFDLSEFDLHFALGTDHPRLDWSPRPPEGVRDPRLPGPDGVGSPAPLIVNGLVPPADVDRTVAAFAAGFKREHGAFRYGALALVNHGSHYGFVQEGTIFSKLQPGLATLIVMNDGRLAMKSWMPGDETSLASIRYARQNGVPLIESDPAHGRAEPGALVNLWGPGNWSGSASEVLRTLRAGACVEETGSRRFLLYGYFSAATPSAMARVFQAYQCRYAMQLDINALEHTYLALYVHRDRERLVEHLVQGMEQCDSRTREGLAPRFLGAPDDRDFFYLTRRERP
jgi:hypothetical protein